jgi:hypothetical protein
MFKVNGNYSTLTPEGILSVLKNDVWFQQMTPKILENALLFCTIIYLHYYYHKDRPAENDEKNPFQRIGTDLIIKILARDNYKEILQRLVYLGVIEINDSYLPDKYTKSYRLNERFADQKPVARKIKYNLKKLDKLNEYFIEKDIDNFPYLIPQFNNLQLIHIDFEAATKYIEENRNEITNIEHYYRQIHKINSGFTRKIAVSQANRRVHTSLTSFPKILRPFLCLVEQQTGELNFSKCIIDGKNTQPLLICVKMEQEGFLPDVDFKQFCINGTLYDEMAKELNETRSWVKSYMMNAILFTPQNSEYTHNKNMHSEKNVAKKKISLYFKYRFPQVYNWLLTKKIDLKNSGTSENTRNAGGSQLAIEIQKMEAELWIHSLLKFIPEYVIYITIHDSVMIFNPKIEQVKCIAEKVKEIGRVLYNIEIPLTIECSPE